jgi:hypothetical protein
MKRLGKYSIGTGDRFGREGVAQLAAVKAVRDAGVEVDIVWNKSNREHVTIHTEPADQRAAADWAVKTAGWKGAYFVDADHINLKTVDRFIDHCDFSPSTWPTSSGNPCRRPTLTPSWRGRRP